MGNHNSGRPRTTSPEDPELIILGEELVTWATEPTKELRYHLNQWWCLKNAYSKDKWDLMCDKKVFRPYYERARVALAARYVDGSINASIANRFLRLYFPEVTQDENELLKLKAELASKEQKLTDANQLRNTLQAIRELKAQEALQGLSGPGAAE